MELIRKTIRVKWEDLTQVDVIKFLNHCREYFVDFNDYSFVICKVVREEVDELNEELSIYFNMYDKMADVNTKHVFTARKAKDWCCSNIQIKILNVTEFNKIIEG